MLVRTMNMLKKVVQGEWKHFRAMANVWLASGAPFFSVVDANGQVVYRWDSEEHITYSSVSIASIHLNAEVIGTLQVALAENACVRAQLESNVLFIERLLTFEADMNDVIVELVENQDQKVALYKLTEAMDGLLDIEETMQTLVRAADGLVKCDGLFLAQHVDNQYVVYQYPENYIEEDFLHDMLASMYYNPTESTNDSIYSAVKNLLYVPIINEGKHIAGMGFVNNRDGEFNSPDLKMARMIARQAGGNISRSLLYKDMLQQERYEAELDMAAEIQSALLPDQIPDASGLDIAGNSIQARQVGGDFYDFVYTPGSHFGFVVGDVAGKGVPSALLMSVTGTLMRSQANSMMNPAEILSFSNDNLYDYYTRVSRFTTSFVGMYLHDERRIYYANAGHSPVIYKPLHGKSNLLPAADMPLGILPDVKFEMFSIPFEPGDLLIVATDGFSEATNLRGEMFGYDRLLSLSDACAEKGASEILKIFFEEIEKFSVGHSQDDDQTLVILKGMPS